MTLLQGRAVETNTEALIQTKQPEVNDLIWLCPSRVAKQEMDLSGISLHSPWILVTLTKQEEEQSMDSTTWFFALTGLTGKGDPQADGSLGVPQRLDLHGSRSGLQGQTSG